MHQLADGLPAARFVLRHEHWLVNGIGAAVHLGFLFQVFHPTGLTVMALVFPALVVSPCVLLGAGVVMARGRARASQVARVVSVGYLLFAAWAYWDTIYVHPDPQGRLIFMVMPVLGVLGAAVLLIGLMMTRVRPS